MRECDNCRRPVLDTDTVCWHCGWKLSPAVTATAPEIETPTNKGQDEIPAAASPVLVIFYGSLTFFISIALLWLLNTLSQSPTIINTGPPSTEWVTIQDPEKRFMINIPALWQWSFAGQDQASSPENSLLQNLERSTLAISPLGTLAPDSDIMFLAGNDTVLLVAAGSKRLNQLEPQQAVTSLQQETFEGVIIEDARQVQDESGENKAIFTIQHEDPALQCRQLFVIAAESAYLVAACAPTRSAHQFASEFNFVLDSFRAYK